MTRMKIKADARTNLAAELRRKYEEKRTIRSLAEEHSLSYGTTHTLLAEAGTEFRPRGGANGRGQTGG